MPPAARITDLHVWRIGRGQYAVAVDIVTSAEVDGNYFRRALSIHEELVHLTIEVTRVGADQILGTRRLAS